MIHYNIIREFIDSYFGSEEILINNHKKVDNFDEYFKFKKFSFLDVYCYTIILSKNGVPSRYSEDVKNKIVEGLIGGIYEEDEEISKPDSRAYYTELQGQFIKYFESDGSYVIDSECSFNMMDSEVKNYPRLIGLLDVIFGDDKYELALDGMYLNIILEKELYEKYKGVRVFDINKICKIK